MSEAIRFGFDVGRKFNADGSPRRFPGNTIISPLVPGSEIFRLARDERDACLAGPFGACLTGLPDLGVSMRDGHAVLVAGSLSNDPAIEADIRQKLLKTVGQYNKDLQRSQQIYDVIVRAESLPRTATGKIKRYELQEQITG